MAKTTTVSRPGSGRSFRDIEKDILSRIACGDWPAGTKIPARTQLARDYCVAVATVERAVSGLLLKGALSANRTGTFVLESGDVRSSSGDFAAEETQRFAPPSFAESRSSAKVLGMIASLEMDPNEGDNLWCRSVIRALEQSFLPSGDGTVLCNIDRGPRTPTLSLMSAFEQVRSQGATVVVIIDIYAAYDAEEVAEFYTSGLANEIPTVLVASRTLRCPIPYVSSNLSYAGFLAVEHLLKQGVEELRFVAPQSGGWVEERIASAQEGVALYKRPEDILRIIRGNPTLPTVGTKASAVIEAAKDTTKKMIADGTLREGVIAANDVTARGILLAASEAGLSPGRDFLIVGVDDDPLSVEIGLSSVRPPWEDLGREADLLLRRVVRHQSAGMHVALRPQLIVRNSSRRPAGGERDER